LEENVKKSILAIGLLFSVWCTEGIAQQYGQGPKLIAENRKLSHVLIGRHYYSVELHDQSLPCKNSKVFPFCTTTDSFEIIDNSGKTVFERHVRPSTDPLRADKQGFSSVYGIYVHQLRGASGNALLVQWDWQPADEASCPMNLVLGEIRDRVVAFSAPFCAELKVKSKSRTDSHDVWELADDSFQLALPGQGFWALVPVRMNFQSATLNPAECQGLRLCVYPTQESIAIPESTVSLTLYHAPEATQSEGIQIAPGSKVKILAVQLPTIAIEGRSLMNLGEITGAWLQLAVDGRTGWSHNIDDLAKLVFRESN
jgi:hypothetical protein